VTGTYVPIRERSIALSKFWCCVYILLALAGAGFTATAQERVRLATTTSVQDSGLLPYLLPFFEQSRNCKVDVIAVGTGQALRLGADGEVDLLIVHDPEGEQKLVESGFGIARRTFMVNDFVILGPVDDPARIRGGKSAAAAFAGIQKTGAVFVSRGDESGTHVREKILWQKAGIKPSGKWYMEVGQGMGAVLTIANEKQAYALCDRATFLARMSQLNLRILVEGDAEMLNCYSAIQVNPARFPAVKASIASRLIDWLCSPEGQKLIGAYKVGGRALFTPIAGSGK
jgi:tungstate transport system substrate-binding protein